MKLVVLIFAVVAFPLSAQSSREDRLAILKYGIESEELDVVRALRQETDGEFNEQLKETYASARSDELKQQILLLFSDLKDNGLEMLALKDLTDTTKGNNVLLTDISYLSDLKSTQAADPLMTLTTGSNKVMASAAIRALGKLGASDKTDALIQFYKNPDTDPNLKPDLIWTFGELKAETALDLLVQEYGDSDSQPLQRRIILEALGKIGGDKAWTTVSSALTDTNGDVRAAAVGAVGGFPGKGGADILTPALRDSTTGVRLAAAQAAELLKDPLLKDLLTYRMKKDPDAKVRTAALKAVAAYDDGPSAILALLADRKTDISVWRDALNLALDKAYPGTADTLRGVLDADSKDKNGGILSQFVANALLAKRDAYRPLFAQELASDKASVRAAALRAVRLGKYIEYEDKIKTMAASDPDAEVKAQASDLLKDWAKPTPSPSPAPVPTPKS